MARKRMIDPNIWQSEDFSKLSTLAKLVFIGLFSNADDDGRGRAKAAYIKSILFPYDEGMRVIDIDKTLSEIASNMSVTFYLHNDSEYYSLDKWSKWQKIDHKSNSSLPSVDEATEIIRRTLDEGSTNVSRTLAPNIKEFNLTEDNVKECLLLEAETASSQPPVISIILNDKTYYPIYQSDVDLWTGLYAAVDVMQELRNYAGWADANPQKRKTKSGIKKSINAWLAKEQNKGGKQESGNYRKKTAANNYPQKKYSEAELSHMFENLGDV